MKRNQFIAFTLTSIMAFTSILSVDNIRIYANTNTHISTNENLEDVEVEELIAPVLPAVTKAAWARLATSGIINRVTGSVSASALDLITKNASQIRIAVSGAPNIHAVFDSVYRAMRDAGGASENIARSIANAIRKWVY